MHKFTIAIALFVVIYQIGKTCGFEQNGDTRIVGGSPAVEGQFSFAVSLRVRGKHLCGGSLIRNDTVLTAAHCIIIDEPEYYTVAFNTTTLIESPNTVSMKVTKIIKHKKFNLDINFDYDIAVLKVKPVGSSNKTISDIAIKLNTNPVKDHTNCTVIGWGDTYEGSQAGSPFLQYVEIPIIPKTECVKIYMNLLNSDMLCGGLPGKDSCQGDSGGPLVCNNKLAGIVSFGEGCGKNPGVYTDVSHYLEWIKDAQNNAYIIRQSHVMILLLVTILIFKII
ncbi:anionic trypsin-2-like [Ctenocephalides felis]|uniref:anionic trypsin-2-like n=1 Tax=Ctenocephalides felis TaxID=7515 RepID=UPI000E6E4D0A|nr:anionic trypsin-2-like [Ctenocephalides felis]